MFDRHDLRQLLSNTLLAPVLVSLAFCSGCEKANAPKAKDDKPKEEKVVKEEKKAAEPAQTVIVSSKNKGLEELSKEDRVLAEKQKVCPVTGEPLGSMGKPVKMTVKGRTVFLCCEGCRGEIEKDPDTYLAKLDGKEKPAGDKPKQDIDSAK